MLRRFINRWSRDRNVAKSRQRRRPALGVEALEDRILLDAGLPPAIVVGRTLSAYTTADVQDRQLIITYTVYNEQAEPLSGVLLTDTLQPGVTFRAASQLPDRNGQELAWSLGTIPGFDRASVTLTVALPDPLPFQLDSGARALAMLNAGMVTDDAPAAVLINRVIPADQLVSTPDANTTDPFVQEKAAELDYDPQRIIDFLSGAVGYESYSGSLRGSRGTLWSGAGNALDEASLGVALMRASGIPARYAQGTLSDERARELILSMFPPSFQTLGYIPAGTAVADPANDPKLLAETRNHYWFQFDAGNGLRDIDTTFVVAQVGQTFTTTQGTFTEVPATLRHTVAVKLDAETYSQARAAFGLSDGLSTTTVLSQTFNAVELVGKPMTIGHFVSVSSLGAPVFSLVTNTYTPYLVVYDPALPDRSQAHAITGTGFQEVFTNFPLGTQVLTGLFLNVILRGPGGSSKAYERPLVDRIGYAARNGVGAPGSVSVDPSGPPTISPFDLTTLNILPGLQDSDVAELLRQRATQKVGSVSAEANPTVVAQAEALMAVARAQLAQFAVDSDRQTANYATALSAAAYFDSPRITAFVSHVVPGPTETQVAYEFDLINDSIRAVVAPGQNAQAPLVLATTRGVFDSLLESASLPVAPGAQNRSAITIIQQSVEQGIPLTHITASDLALLQSLNLPADAIARISTDIQNGFEVIVPTKPLAVDGTPTTAWLTYHPVTGEMIAKSQDGGHQGLIEWVAIVGIAHIVTFGVLGAIVYPKDAGKWAKGTTGAVVGVVAVLLPPIGQVFAAIIAGFLALAAIKGDPPLPPVILNLHPPFRDIPGSAASTESHRQPNETPGQVAGTVQASSAVASGNLTASWNSASDNGFRVRALSAGSATITDGNGAVVGTGAVALSLAAPITAGITGNNQYNVNGNGNLFFYAPAGTALGVGADWDNYTATVTGNVALTLTTDGLTLNGSTLPAGTYTVTTNSATLSGSGATTSPTFSGSAFVTVTDGRVELGAGAGNLSVGGTPLDPGTGTALAGYTGSVTVTAGGGGNNPDAVTLSGIADNVLRVMAPSATLTADQNTPVSFPVNIETSLADDYTLSAEAPDGWTVVLTAAGQLTATPKPGLQSGSFTIRIVARSKANPTLVAQTTVTVAVTATQPGIALAVDPDALFTVPTADGAQSPTAFRASVRNLGPAADGFTVSVANLPPGFDLFRSGTAVEVPAGQTGVLGAYLRPNGATLPAPGRPVSFTVTATSTSDPAITDTKTVHFTMPEVHGLTFTATPDAFGTVPGSPVMTTLTLQAVGNVSETVNLSAALSAGLTATGLPPTVTLTPGQTLTIPVALTPAATAPLNSSEAATVTAKFNPLGDAFDRTITIPVRLVVPGADAIANAAVAARQLGSGDLANRLGDLSTALTNLVQQPTNDVARGQSLASLDAVATLCASDPFLAALFVPLSTDRAALAQAATAVEVQAAVSNLATTLGTVATTLADEAAHNFTLTLLTNSQVAQPQNPTTFQLALQNTGTQTTTYDLSLGQLPDDVTGSLGQSSVTLTPGQTVSNLTVTLTPNSTTQSGAFSFTVTATAHDAPAINRAVTGTLTARDEFVSVVAVTATPPFTDPGAAVQVAARILNAVNRVQQANVSYVVKDSAGQTVFTSQPVSITLTVVTSLATVDLGSLDTTNLPRGEYTLAVRVTAPDGQPIPGGTGDGRLLVGSPVTADQSVSPDSLAAGDGTVTTTLRIDSQVPPVGAISVVAQVAVPNAGGTALNGNLLYVSASDGIRVYDVTDASAPQLIRTVGQSASVLRVHGDRLFALQGVNGSTLSVYSLADPTTPQFQGSTFLPYYNLAQQLLVTDTHAFVPVINVPFWLGSHDIFGQDGDLLAVDISNPAAPRLDGVLSNTHGTNNDGIDVVGGLDRSGGPFNIWSAVQVAPTTLLVATTTATETDTQTGVGRINVVDISDPAHMTIVRSLDIPGTVQATGIQLQGNRALVTASSGGWQDFFTGGGGPGDNYGLTGHVVLASLDVTDPRNPQLVHTQALDRGSRNDPVLESRFASLGNGLYAFSNLGASTVGGPGELPQLRVVNAANPSRFGTGSLTVPSDIREVAGSNDLVCTTSANGLIVYRIETPPPVPVTVQVKVPNRTGVAVVPGSFNLPPTEVISNPDFDTLRWDLSVLGGGSQTLTWQSVVSGLQPAEVRDVTLGATLDFVSQATPGTLTLPSQAVIGKQILGLTPASQTVAPGAAAAYIVKLSNPTDTAVTYDLAVLGVPANWVRLATTATVGPNEAVDVPLTLTADSFSATGDCGFTVTASAPSGARASVGGDLILQGQPAPTDPESRGVVVALTPARASAGQGTSARYVVRVTNTGSVADTFSFGAAGLPPGMGVTLEQTDPNLPAGEVRVPPGAGNFRDVTLLLTPALGTNPGDVPFRAVATSTTHGSVTDTADGTLAVLGNGVNVALSPLAGPPGTTFQLTVTNIGQVTDTFDLSLGGPAALAAALGSSKVTLAAGASQTVSVQTRPLDFAVRGVVSLQAVARSQGNPAVQAAATANVPIPPTVGMTAAFVPAAQVLPAPGARPFLLQVHNTGNTEDSYEAVITATGGPISGSLAGLDGMPTQKLPLFRLPGLSTGAILLNADLRGMAPGSVTVQVRSLSDGAIVANATATLTVAVPVPPPALPSPSVVPPPDVTLPVAPGVTVPVAVKFLSTRSLFRSEAGVIVLDADGKINGIAPGERGFLAAALRRRKILVRRGQRPGAVNRVTLQGGQRLLFYLVQNSTLVALLADNPDNTLSGRPLLFFQSADVNPDRKPHLRVVRTGKTIKLLWEDLSRGDQDFNDIILSLRLLSASR